jgi:uncharacterized membrane protein
VVEKLRSVFKINFVRRVLVGVRGSVRSNGFLYIAVLVYITALSTFTIVKDQKFLTTGFDLGIFNQAFSTTLFNHKLFYETGDLSFNPNGSFFGVHFSPILFLLLPFYAIHPSPETLLVMQSVILAFGAFPVYWMARDKLGKNLALGLSIAYLAYPPLILVNINDFHLEAFTSTFFLFSVYYLEQEKMGRFFLFFVLALLTVEFAPVIGIFVALYMLVQHFKKKDTRLKGTRKRIAAIVSVGLISILCLVIALQTKATLNNYTSPVPTTFQISLNPIEWPKAIANDFGAKMLFIAGLFGPLAFLPFLAPEPLIMALPWIGLSFISTYPWYHSVYYQYTSFVTPFIFMALPTAIERLRLPNAKRILQLLLLCTAIFGLYLMGSTAFLNSQLPLPNEHIELMQKILTLIPANASLLTENDIFPSVSNRTDAYMYLPNSTSVSVDYILVDNASKWYVWKPDISGALTLTNSYAEAALRNGSYGVLASADGILLLKKGYTGEPEFFVPYNSSFNYKNLTFSDTTASAVEDPSSTSGRVLFHSSADTENTFWHGPYIVLSPGLYTATFVVKVDRASDLGQNDSLLTVDVTASSGGVTLAKKYVYGMNVSPNGGWFNVTLVFGLTTPAGGVEFRGYDVGNNSVYLDYIAVRQMLPQPVAELAFYSDSMRVDKGTVSDGVIVHSTGSGICWIGPYVSLPKGNYIARFWLKLDKPYNGSLLNIDVSIDSGKQTLTSLTVHSSNFEEVGKWREFDVKFTLQNDTNMVEFRGVNVREAAPISLLAVEVYPDTGRIPQMVYKTTFTYEDLSLDQGIVSNGVMTHVKGTGAFWHGPYMSLPKGNYIARFWLKLDKPYNGSLLDVEVATNSGQNVLTSLTVHSSNFEEIGKWREFDVKFTLQSDTNVVEFRGVNVRENALISLLSVEVYPDTGRIPLMVYKTTFNYVDLLIDQGTVSNGVMTHVKGAGTFWHGPYASFAKGNYTAKFWLKLDKAYNGTLLDVDVATNSGQNVLASLTVHSSDFVEIGKWQEFDVKFTLQSDTNVVEFRGVNAGEAAPISLLSVEVYPGTGG